MRVKNNWNNKQEYLALSCIIHAVVLVCLSLQYGNIPQSSSPFFDFKHPDTTNQQSHVSIPEKQTSSIDPLSAPLINAPCILYKPGGSPQTKSSPPSSLNTPEKVKASLEGETEGDTLKDPSLQPSQSEKQLPESLDSTNHKDQKKNIEKLNIIPTPKQKTSNSTVPTVATITASTFLHSNEPLAAAPPMVEESSPEKNSTQESKISTLKAEKLFDASEQQHSQREETGDGTRKRKLVLSDLFKNLATLPLFTSQEGQGNGDGSGAPAVIVQGDIRYHSFVTSLVDHINSTSIHKNGTAIISALVRSGTVKQNLKLSITIQKNGKVLDARILISSGCPQLDSFWVATAYEASPFAPLPTHFKRDMVRVELVTQL